MIIGCRSTIYKSILASYLTGCLALTGCTIGSPETSDIEDDVQATSTVTLTSSLKSGIPEGAELDDSEPIREPVSGSAPTALGPNSVNGTDVTSPSANPADITGQLQSAVDQAVAIYGGTAGIAFSDGSTTVAAGDISDAPSWSTIKVPIAIAALRQDPSQLANATAAIQWSDNAAAEALWESLGTPDQAGIATGDVMAEGGSGFPINTMVTRSGFSSFGQTMWSTNDQARFVANLGCISGSAPVLQNMGMVEPSQSWGIGQLPGAKFKGGWGPKPDGAYSARQFGLTTNSATGQTRALAIIVNPGSGTFGDAQSMANTLISKVQVAIPQAPATSC